MHNHSLRSAKYFLLSSLFVFYIWSGISTRAQNKYSITEIQSDDNWKGLHQFQLTVLKKEVSSSASFADVQRIYGIKSCSRNWKIGVEPSLNSNTHKRVQPSLLHAIYRREKDEHLRLAPITAWCQIHLLPVSLLLLKTSFKKKGFCPFFFHKHRSQQMQFCNLPRHCDLHIGYDKIMLLKGEKLYLSFCQATDWKKIFYLIYFIFYTTYTDKLFNILVFHNISGMHIQY